MAGKRKVAEQEGPPAKKRKTCASSCTLCLLCPADNKKRSFYGIWHEDTKLHELKYCSQHYKQLQAQGEDVSGLITRNKATELKTGATCPPAFPPNSCHCRNHQQDQPEIHADRSTVRSICCLPLLHAPAWLMTID
jgi:hypothetical protein